MSKRALIVEDDINIAELLKIYLQKDGFETENAYDGRKAVELAETFRPDIILLDIMLPVMDGWQVCREVRKTSQVPIIMLTAKGESMDKVSGLEMGADDYVTKPFVPVEVLARVRSHLRRYARLGAKPAENAGTITIGGIVLDDRAKTVAVDGDEVSLTPIEYDVLKLLMENPGKVYSTRTIYETVWQENPYGSENAVAVHIRHLREKIEINPSEPRYIKVVWGRGYKMEVLK